MIRFDHPLALLLLLLAGWFTWYLRPLRAAAHSDQIALAMRLAIVTSLVLSLAGLQVVQVSSNLAVVFLLDRSDSLSPAAQAAAEDYVRQALKSMPPDDRAAVVVFGKQALVERGLSNQRELESIASHPTTSASDLAGAMRLGLALFPPDTVRRMVLLSDGQHTGSQAALKSVAASVASQGVQLLAVPLSTQAGDEVAVTGVQAPARLQPGERFDLAVEVASSSSTRARLRVLAGDEILYQGEQQLRAGRQTFTIPMQPPEPGMTVYRVQIEAQADTRRQNNEGATFTQVRWPPRILLITSDQATADGVNPQEEVSALKRALQTEKYDLAQTTASALPADLTALSQYAALALVDVPARQLSTRQLQALQAYVRDLGGGLITVGGPTSFAPGGYFRTPLEETLPVEMQIKDPLRRPSLALLFIIDRSGSMSETSGGVTKLELAKEAVLRATELLFPGDRVGVVAFEEDASWVFPLGEVEDTGAIQEAVGSLRPGGGTDILAGVQAAARTLPNDPAKVKHIILLTDGGADPTGIPQLITDLSKKYGITVSTVGVGRDAAPYLADLAELGGGRYHFTMDPATIPAIFTEETSLATRAYLVEKQFLPQAVRPSPILAGLADLPPLYGYVLVSPKDAAPPLLVAENGDPILAAWQYGLGRTLAFTSDANSRWGRDWLTWPSFAAFWGQAVAYVQRAEPSSPMQISVTTSSEDTADRARLTIDAQQEDGAPLEQARLEAALVAPDGVTQTVQLEQTAPGRYAGAVVADQPGVYLIQVSGTSAQGTPLQTQTGWSIPYSAEYLPAEPDPGAMARLVSQAGGRLSTGDPGEVFMHDLSAAQAARPLWPFLLALAMILLPFDIAVRRLAWMPVRVALPQVQRFFHRRREGRAALQPGATISAWQQVHHPPGDTQSVKPVAGDVQPTLMDERINKVESELTDFLPPEQSLSSERALPPDQAILPDQPLSPESVVFPDHAVSPDQTASAPSLAARLLDTRRKKKDRPNE